MIQIPKLVVLTGLPRAGKSTLATALRQDGYVHVSSDGLRDTLFGSGWDVHSYDAGKEEALVHTMKGIAQTFLQQGSSVVVDCTAYSKTHRDYFLDTTYGSSSLLADKYLVWMRAEHKTLEDRAFAAGRTLDGLLDLQRRWEDPIAGEGYKFITCDGAAPVDLYSALGYKR